MRESLKELQQKILVFGGDIDEKDIDLRNILFEIVRRLDEALPQEVEPD